jgi:hypothetical protein
MNIKYLFWIALVTQSWTIAAPRIGDAEPTPLDQWRPVDPGTWVVWEVKFSTGARTEQKETTSFACPYVAPFFLHSFAPIKIGKAGCEYLTYRVSDQQFHIAGRCKNLRRGVHQEMTTLIVAKDGHSFSSATSWLEPNGLVTLRREGAWLSSCTTQ